jgi:hypothetical protein
MTRKENVPKTKIGFSTGVFWHNYRHNLLESYIEKIFRLNCSVLELNSVVVDRLDSILGLSKELIVKFGFLSLHAPSSEFVYDRNKETFICLNKISKILSKFNLDTVVLHPTSVKDWTVFKDYGDLPICIENMDNRKTTGRNYQELKNILEEYGFGFVLDLQHCYSNDKTMKLSNELKEKFKNQIRLYHVSGYKNDYHFPIYKTKQKKILSGLENNSNIIIESPFETYEEMELELQYILRNLSKI